MKMGHLRLPLFINITDDRTEDFDGDGLTEAQEEDDYGTSDLNYLINQGWSLWLSDYQEVITCDPNDVRFRRR